MIVFYSDAYLVLNKKACSDSYSTVIKCRRCAVEGARIIKIILYTYLFP